MFRKCSQGPGGDEGGLFVEPGGPWSAQRQFAFPDGDACSVTIARLIRFHAIRPSTVAAIEH